jgi:hypothetical protein
MPSARSKLKLDEQSFEELLAAAYTVQQHNATLKRTSGTSAFCRQCGVSLREGEWLCRRCAAAGQEFRPGERLQRNWATLWQMGQQRGWRPERPAAAGDEQGAGGNPESGTADFEEPTAEPAVDGAPLPDRETTQNDGPSDQTLVAREQALLDLLAPEDSQPSETDSKADSSRFTDSRLTLRFHRADVYLGLAIIVSVLAVLWALFSASPADIRRGVAGAGPPARVHLSPWERALVKLGIAEAPDPPPPVSRGDPSVRVWVDPHTAQYYCLGEELYGKTADGRFTSQREAQMDQFAPAGRAPCD